jgi:hypothetical protein
LIDLVGFAVCAIENLLLLEIHLYRGFVGEVDEGLFEFDEILHA